MAIRKILGASLLAGAGFGFLAYYYKDLKKSYGWLPDLPDPRDYLFEPRAPEVQPRDTINLSTKFPFPPENQGNIGSCTAHATASALEYLKVVNNEPPIHLSRLFGYYNTRVIENTIDKDIGGSLRDALKAANQYGVCPETDWPYSISEWGTKPPDKAYLDASSHIVTSYERLSTLDDMKKCLSEGYPFIFGFTVYKSFESTDVAKSGILNMPQSKEVKLGNHAVVAVGYSESVKTFLIRNSWGASWGMGGYFVIPYNYIDPNSNLASDFWVLRKDY